MNGCHNRAPFVEAFQAQDGWKTSLLDVLGLLFGVEARRMVAIPFRMSPVCNYTKTDLGQTDKGCTGCTWRLNA